MIGAIIGDLVGSRFEFHNHRSKDFDLFTEDCFVTDDSIMTLAAAKAMMETEKTQKSSLDQIDSDFEYLSLLGENTVKYMQKIGRQYPHCGYGGRFHDWIFSHDPKPYNSYGNGAAMRISPVGFAGKTESEVASLSEAITSVSHDHEEGLKGAEATALCIFMARKGYTKREIRRRIEGDYYPLDFTIDEIRETYAFNETCQDTVPQAIEAFLESTSFEDAIRTAISVGGDSDTLAAITGSIAEAYYGVPSWIIEKALTYLDERLYGIYDEWEVFMGWDRKIPGFHLLTKYIGKITELQSMGELHPIKKDIPENEYRRPVPTFTDLADQFAEEFLQFLENRLEYTLTRSDSISLGAMLPWEHDSFRYTHPDTLNENQILSMLMDMLRIHKVDKEALFRIMEDGSLLVLLKKLKSIESPEYLSDPEEIVFEIGGYCEGDTRYHLKFSEEGALLVTSSKRDGLKVSRELSREASEELLRQFKALHVEYWNHEYIDPGILDGTGWTLSVKYKGHRGTVWTGMNAFPPNWENLAALFSVGQPVEEEDKE
ncbi:ADP-ribosylglycohydrolase family protein [Proteiniclasticum sp. C24MP]|uniref:ADP-ribosylglycohydrolase family protein n=1 Tax=Proteiniclasticum sp. C24MP TaxID=3374101 RepID=UPI003754E982